MRDQALIPIEGLKDEPYGSIICYPKRREDELQSRIKELEMHGIIALEFNGKSNTFNVPVLGKGYVGVVVIAHRYGQRLALKMRRVDADRFDLYHEAEMLEKANSVGVGPAMVNVSKNFLLTQLIDGELLPSWLKRNGEIVEVRQVLNEVLEQCWKLDLAGLDHGELSKAHKHVIVDNYLQPWIVDFETSSDRRKPANVTAICQYLIMSGGSIPQLISKLVGEIRRDEVIEALRNYKKKQTRASLDKLMRLCFY